MLDGEIIYLKGVGPQKADVLAKEYDIHTYGDLLEYFPFRMVDRSHISTLDSFNADEPYIVFKGRISELHTVGTGRTTRLEATFTDGTGVMQLVWFQGLKWVKELLQKSQIFIVAGKPSMYGYSLQLVHPDIEIATNDEGTGTHPLMPVYHTTEKSKSKGITSKTFARLTDTLLKQLPAYLPETLPTDTIAKLPKYELPQDAEAHPATVYLPHAKQNNTFVIKPGLGQEYALRFRYKNTSGAPIKTRLTITDSKRTILVDREISFPTTPNKFKMLSTTTGTQINAGTYTVRIDSKDVEFKELEIQ